MKDNKREISIVRSSAAEYLTFILQLEKAMLMLYILMKMYGLPRK